MSGPSGDGDSQAAALLQVLDLEERDRDVFVGQTPTTRLQRIFGGQVAGQALMAAGLTVPEGRDVHSLHAYFLRPGDPHEEIRYTVDRIRDGRSFTTRRVIGCQWRRGEDVAIFALTADFHAEEPAVVEHSLPMPAVPAPEELPSLADVAARHGQEGSAEMEISRAVEQRLLEDPFDGQAKEPPTRVWMRVAGRLPAQPAVHAAALTFVSDLTLLGAGLVRVGGWQDRYAGASLDHAVWFHAPVRADDWFLYETDSPAASGGRALCFGRVWSADGTHVATVAQEGLLRAVGR
ncbi:acyl-CoA thioesterase [Geodermatophilus sabuli]|uniref:Acyl-CoA thioesterase 2 n=1 Tax=Geodermatophilus sabuli TaxID=1564158 RepID=A0A285E8D6_9ACTN|nr:acyl-CoA thioesterase II [Geodermatophilus sabuli]MBB3081995.1 acyl-CoA thioesterase-2 [Geodermatophilus sabuli]SNX95133.1 acyl-CoA thioesterase-2 [Geodermatophilus sabuli]